MRIRQNQGIFATTIPFGLILGLGLWIAAGSASPVFGALPKVPEGFQIRLVAAVPAVQYPCQVATAPDGSLFVAEDPMDQVGPYEPADRPHPPLPRGQGPGRLRREAQRDLRHGLARRRALRHEHALPDRPPRHRRRRQGRRAQGPVQGPRRPAGIPNDFNDHIVSGIQFGIDGYLYISVGDKGVPKATGPDGRTAQVVGRRHAPLPARRHRARGLLHRHPQPPRAQPRRPRQPLHLRQHRRRPRLVDPRDAPRRRRLLRLSVRLPRPARPHPAPDGRVRRRLPLRRGRLQARTPGPRSTAGRASGPSGASGTVRAFRFAPDGADASRSPT